MDKKTKNPPTHLVSPVLANLTPVTQKEEALKIIKVGNARTFQTQKIYYLQRFYKPVSLI